MKLFIKLMFLIIVAAVAAPFLLKGPSGTPLISLNGLHAPELKLSDLGKAADGAKADLSPAQDTPARMISVFKWQDESGVWH